MQEEKLIEVSLEAISSRVQEVRDSLQAFLAKLEMEQMNWFVFLSSRLLDSTVLKCQNQ